MLEVIFISVTVASHILDTLVWNIFRRLLLYWCNISVSSCCGIWKLSTSFAFLWEVPAPFQLVLHFVFLVMFFHKALQLRVVCTHDD